MHVTSWQNYYQEEKILNVFPLLLEDYPFAVFYIVEDMVAVDLLSKKGSKYRIGFLEYNVEKTPEIFCSPHGDIAYKTSHGNLFLYLIGQRNLIYEREFPNFSDKVLFYNGALLEVKLDSPHTLLMDIEEGKNEERKGGLTNPFSPCYTCSETSTGVTIYNHSEELANLDGYFPVVFSDENTLILRNRNYFVYDLEKKKMLYNVDFPVWKDGNDIYLSKPTTFEYYGDDNFELVTLPNASFCISQRCIFIWNEKNTILHVISHISPATAVAPPIY